MSGGELWRVGHRGDPLAFTPFELCAWNHRFDDARRRFRTVYCAERPETSLREALADLRPNLKARRAFAEAFGAAALEDLPAAPVTSRWREEHLLAPAELVLDGELIDLSIPAVRTDLEQRHSRLLVEHGLAHLDLHEITSRRRVVTQTIATDLFDRCNAGALRLRSAGPTSLLQAWRWGKKWGKVPFPAKSFFVDLPRERRSGAAQEFGDDFARLLAALVGDSL